MTNNNNKHISLRINAVVVSECFLFERNLELEEERRRKPPGHSSTPACVSCWNRRNVSGRPAWPCGYQWWGWVFVRVIMGSHHRDWRGVRGRPPRMCVCVWVCVASFLPYRPYRCLFWEPGYFKEPELVNKHEQNQSLKLIINKKCQWSFKKYCVKQGAWLWVNLGPVF